MLLNRNSSVYIASHHSWDFVALTVKDNIVGVWHSRIDWHLEDFLLLFHSLSLASFAFIFFFHHLASTVTAVATGLTLSHYPRS